MSYNIFLTNTVTDANKVLDNFYFFGGNRLPYTQTTAGTLTAVNNTYDIGVTATAWKNVYCKTINITNNIYSNSQTLWTLEVEYLISATCQLITISGLNGDNAGDFKINFECIWGTATATKINLWFNDDTNTANYNNFLTQVKRVVSSGETTTAEIKILEKLNNTTTAGFGFAEMILKTKSGYSRIGYGSYFSSNENNIDISAFSCNLWKNITTTITSIIFESSIVNSIFATSRIRIFKRG